MKNTYTFLVRSLVGGVLATAAVVLFVSRYLTLGTIVVFMLAGAYSVSGED